MEAYTWQSEWEKIRGYFINQTLRGNESQIYQLLMVGT